VLDARRRGVHARRDRRHPRHRNGNVEGATVAGARQAAGRARGFRGGVGVMSDDRFDEWLRQAAQDYHRPPATPREELWTRIAAARAARRRHVIVVRPTLRWGVGIAAVLALGVAIGRWSARR